LLYPQYLYHPNQPTGNSTIEISIHLKINIMSKEKEGKEKEGKKKAVKSLKEKRADKALKRKEKSEA